MNKTNDIKRFLKELEMTRKSMLALLGMWAVAGLFDLIFISLTISSL